MNEDDWDYLPGTWNVFENSNGWRVVLDTSRLPGRMLIKERKTYAAALLWALNHGQPEAGDILKIPGEHAIDREVAAAAL